MAVQVEGKWWCPVIMKDGVQQIVLPVGEFRVDYDIRTPPKRVQELFHSQVAAVRRDLEAMPIERLIH